MRILHLPTPVGGMPWGLAQAESALGLNSKVLYRQTNWLDYPCDINLQLEKRTSNLLKLKKLIATFLSIRDKFDVFHFNWGSSLINLGRYGLPQAELPFYPPTAKLFVTYNVCDARQKYPTMSRLKIAACHDPACYSGICNSGRRDKIRKKNIAKMARYAKHMWAVNPDLLRFLPSEKSSFLPYVVNSDNIRLVKPDFGKKKLNVVHAPTDRAAKGSKYILNALDQLKHKYPDHIDVNLVENISHQKAIQIYQQADLVIDQILVGWYGSLAVEVMSMGLPVICRIEESDLCYIPKKMAADVKNAFICADPSNIKEIITKCINDRKFLKTKSEAASEYARSWHNPEFVARITSKAYAGN
jgi:glycosyltransferase involved in cell wall biosynthesis